MGGVHKRYHDIVVQTLIYNLNSGLKARKCPTLRQLTGTESSMVPDVNVESTKVALDYTYQINPDLAYEYKKKKKYDMLENLLVPIVMAPTLHKLSQAYLGENSKFPKAARDMAYWVAQLAAKKQRLHNRFVKESNTKFLETLAERTQQCTLSRRRATGPQHSQLE